MRSAMAEVWRELQKKMPAEQAFFLSLLLAFCQYYGEAARGKSRWIEGGDPGEWNVSREWVEGALRDVQGYDLRVALFRLCDAVDWAGLEEAQLRRPARELMRVLERARREGRRAEEVFDDIFGLQEGDGIWLSTPACVRELIADLLGTKRTGAVADFCCGGASLGLALWKRLKTRNQEMRFHGEEENRLICDIARINLYVHGVGAGEIAQRDVLEIPGPSERGVYDLILLDVPKGRNATELCDHRDPRLLWFDRKNIYADWLFILDALYRLGPSGTAAVLVTPGALIRSNEELLRKQVVENGWLEAVITLPFHLYPKHYTGTELLILNKAKRQKDRTIFIDISREYEQDGTNCCRITERGRRLACRSFLRGEEIRGVSAVCSAEELRKNHYSFKPLQYIRQEEEWEFDSDLVLKDVAQVVRRAQVARRSDVAEDGDAYFLNIRDIRGQRISLESADRVGIDSPVCKEKYRVRQDDILITSKGTALKLALAEDLGDNVYISGNLTMIRVDPEKYDPYILFEYLNSGQGRIALERIQSGTTIRILSSASLERLKIPAYDLERMKSVGARLKENQLAFYREEEERKRRFWEERKRLLKELEGLG